MVTYVHVIRTLYKSITVDTSLAHSNKIEVVDSMRNGDRAKKTDPKQQQQQQQKKKKIARTKDKFYCDSCGSCSTFLGFCLFFTH